MVINLSEAKAHLGLYVERASAGEVITICERNKPMAQLRPALASFRSSKLKFGVLKGKFQVPDDFNAPLAEFECAFYGQAQPRSRPTK